MTPTAKAKIREALSLGIQYTERHSPIAQSKMIEALALINSSPEPVPSLDAERVYTREQVEDAMVLAVRSWTTYGSVNYIHIIKGIDDQLPSSEAQR